MAYSTERHVSDGTMVNLPVSLLYFSRDEITVYFNNVLVPITDGRWAWVGSTSNQIAFTPAVPSGVEVMFRRSTTLVLLNSFVGGAQFKFSTLDENFYQILRIAQEAVEGGSLSDIYGDLDVHGYQIKNIGPASADNDAVSLGQYRADALGASVARVSAEAAAASALASKTAAATSESNALAYRNTAQTAATNAGTSAGQASSSASQASTSATNAATSATNAANSATSAGTSATNAANSAASVANALRGPLVSAYQSTGTGLATGVSTKLLFDTEEYDTANCFANSRFTPNVAGWYWVVWGIQAGAGATGLGTSLTKNGSTYKNGSFVPSGPGLMTSQVLVFCNGSTDYIEIFAVSTASNMTTVPGQLGTYLNIALARPQ